MVGDSITCLWTFSGDMDSSPFPHHPTPTDIACISATFWPPIQSSGRGHSSGSKWAGGVPGGPSLPVTACSPPRLLHASTISHTYPSFYHCTARLHLVHATGLTRLLRGTPAISASMAWARAFRLMRTGQGAHTFRRWTKTGSIAWALKVCTRLRYHLLRRSSTWRTLSTNYHSLLRVAAGRFF